MWERGHYDLIIMDVQMVGIVATETIRNENAPVADTSPYSP